MIKKTDRFLWFNLFFLSGSGFALSNNLTALFLLACLSGFFLFWRPNFKEIGIFLIFFFFGLFWTLIFATPTKTFSAKIISKPWQEKGSQIFWAKNHSFSFLVKTTPKPLYHQGETILLYGPKSKVNKKTIFLYPYLQKKQFSWWEKQRQKSQQKCQEKINAYFSPPLSQILSALLLGKSQAISFSWKKKFARLGISHLFVVSGLHLFIIFFFFFLFFSFCRLPFPFNFLATLLALGGFLFFLGFPPAASRAGLMAGLLIIGKISQRKINFLALIAFSATLLVLFQPNLLAKAGFQLSYLAILGIYFFYPYFSTLKWGQKFPYLWSLLSLTLAAQLATLPLSLYYFHFLPLLSWLANLILVPFLPLILLFAFFFLLSPPFLCSFWQAINFASLSLFLKIISWFNHVPFCCLIIHFPLWATLSCYALFLLLLIWKKNYAFSPQNLA